MDTGADISLVKQLPLSKSINVNSVKRKNLGGAFGGCTLTQGSVKVDQDPSDVPFKFHVIEDNVKLTADGVLGRDSM